MPAWLQELTAFLGRWASFVDDFCLSSAHCHLAREASPHITCATLLGVRACGHAPVVTSGSSSRSKKMWLKPLRSVVITEITVESLTFPGLLGCSHAVDQLQPVCTLVDFVTKIETSLLSKK